MTTPANYVNNAVAMWTAYGAHVETTEAYSRFEAGGVKRVILRRPAASADGFDVRSVEDSWGLSAEPEGVIAKRMAVMDRPAGPLEIAAPPGATIGAVRDPDELAEAERVIVEGFPQKAYHPWRRGVALPERLLGVPGWTVWLARRDAAAAAAGFTYDDGTAVGVYWLATLPEHRSAGLARAIMTASLAAHPDRTATLVATAAGEPLYKSLGFVTVSTAAWYFRVPKD